MISIVIISFNQQQLLEKTLPLFLEQQEEELDICVVDKNSEDDTISVLEKMEETEPRLHHMSLPKTAHGLNKDHLAVMLGVRNAVAERIILTRPQCAPSSPNWLHEVATRWTDRPILLLTEICGKKPTFRVRFAAMMATHGHARWALGHVLGYSKSFFMSHRGFPMKVKKKEGTFNILVKYFSNPQNTLILTDGKYSVHSVVS